MKKFVLAMMLFVATLGFAQSTYSTQTFSADFTGPVTVSSLINDAKTSSRTFYFAQSNGITESVITVDIITDGVLAVDYTSSDFYRSNTVFEGETLSTTTLSNGMYNGHPYSYGCYLSTVEGVNYIRFTRYIIVNSKRAIFISMIMVNSPNSAKTPAGAVQVWQDFENTLVIK